MKALVLCLVLAVSPAVLLAQPNCTQLGFNNILPSPGTQLPRCVSDEQQCCTADYIERVEGKVIEILQEFLAEEFDDVIEDYRDDIENVFDYFTEDFPKDLLEQLPGAIFIDTSDPTLRQVIQELIENYEMSDENNFNVRRFLNSLLESLNEVLVRQFVSNPSGQQCVRRIINSGINRNAVNEIADQLQEVRRSITTLRRIGSFLERERRRLRNINPLQQCIDVFIDLAFCSRCVQRTPPLCLNTCNALVRGCYSPYYTALNRNYDRLWRVVRDVLSVANSTVNDILTGESAIIDIGSLTADISSECGLSVNAPGTRRRRRGEEEMGAGTHGTNDNTNRTISTNTTNGDNNGRDDDMSRMDDDNDRANDTNDETSATREQSNGGLKGDSSENNTSSSTRGDTTGNSDSSMRARETDVMFIPPGLVNDAVALTGAFQYGQRGLHLCLDALVEDRGPCYIEDMDRTERFCSNENFCTAPCNCWDGEAVRPNDTESFDLNNIEDQDQNPVLDISQEVLQNEGSIIGDPVAAFLASEEFTSVAPNGIQEEERSSSAGVIISITIILLSSLMALM